MPSTADTNTDKAPPRIEALDLNVVFGEGPDRVHAVIDASFSIRAGETYGLVGESGSGKSTVLRAISGLNRDWSGAILIDGVEQKAKRSLASFKDVQMVFQDPYGSLHPRHTVDRVLSEPIAIHKSGDAEARIDSILRDVGLGPEFRFRYPHQLSGGQRQRVAIARTLMLEPRILLLDEPTSALDVSVQAEILNLLKRLKEEHGFTFILVSHDLSVISHMCDRLAVMNAGRIIEEITADQLRGQQLEHPYTRQLLSASQGYDRETARRLVTFD